MSYRVGQESKEVTMKLLMIGFLAASIGGCVVHAHPMGHSRVSHIHDDHCGHYWDNGNWHVVERHRHGAGCGHVFHDGYWANSRVVVVDRGHHHDAHCGHYYHGNTVYHMHGHRHGPGCGHNYNGKVWVSVRF
jgi:hypothetical protein